MLPVNSTTCTQDFELEFNWLRCMENQTSMTRTSTGDGRNWLYSGYLTFTYSEPIMMGGIFLSTRSQTLSRPVVFVAPRLITVDMTVQSLRIWNRNLVVPELVYVNTVQDTNIQMSTIYLGSKILNPWTFATSPQIVPETAAIFGLEVARSVIISPMNISTVCDYGRVDEGVCPQSMVFNVCCGVPICSNIHEQCLRKRSALVVAARLYRSLSVHGTA